MIAISSDIIADVAAAADPQRARAALRRLESLAAPATHNFASLVHSSAPPRRDRQVIAPAQVRPGRETPTTRGQAGEDPAAAAYRALGGVLLQKMFETMLPNLGTEAGRTAAASMWKSMLAQQLADSVSASIFPSSIAPTKTNKPFGPVAVATFARQQVLGP